MDKHQLEEIVDINMTPIYRYCVMLLKNHHDAQDCTQNTFVKLAQSNLVDADHINNWLYTVARNECISFMRKNWYRTHFDSELIERMPTDSEKESLSIILNAPQKYREVLYLYYYEGYDQKEIAQLLKISVDAVKKRMVRGRESLKTMLEGESV